MSVMKAFFSILGEIIKQVFDSLMANKLRSILSALGIVIGISFVIIMGYLINGLDLAMEKTFNILGTDMLYVDKWDWAGGKSWRDLRQRKDITLEQAKEFVERAKTPQLAVPLARTWSASIEYDGESFSQISMQGTTSEYALTPAGSIKEGRFFTPFENKYGAHVVVLGNKVYETMFPDGNGIGKTVKIRGRKFEVIGYIEKRGMLFVNFVDNMCFMPLQTFLGIFGSSRRSLSVAVKAGSEERLPEVRSETMGLMRVIRNTKPHEEEDFSINESKVFERTTQNFQMMVWSVGIILSALSFVVGIIGIMNIMFVSVAERTKEIGIRKAVGAKKSVILLQFITESVVLCLIGAMISFIGCSILILGIALVVPQFVPDLDFLPKILPANMFAIATLFAIFFGVLAGLIPAVKAAQLAPVEALRYE